MKRTVLFGSFGIVLLVLAAVGAGADELTVNSILGAQRSGAPAANIIAMINNPANTVVITAGDIVTLRRAGVPESVIVALWAHIPAPKAPSAALRPDDARLVDIVRLIESGMSESIIVEQVRQSSDAYTLSVNDLLYLKENSARESIIEALMTSGAGVPPVPATTDHEAVVFEDLELVRVGFWRRHRVGELILEEDVFSWKDKRNPNKESFTFQVAGLEKVWYTCEARTHENFCYEINFKIVRGDNYRFRDVNRDTGSNAAVTNVMETLRTRFPRLNFSAPNVK